MILWGVRDMKKVFLLLLAVCLRSVGDLGWEEFGAEGAARRHGCELSAVRFTESGDEGL